MGNNPKDLIAFQSFNYPKFLLLIMCVIIAGCSEHDSQNENQPLVSHQPDTKGQIQLNEEDFHANYRILDEIPKTIKQIENLVIFPANSKAPFTVRLVPEQSYGKTGDFYFTITGEVTVDDMGRVIVTDQGSDYALTVHVFNKDGSYRTPLGRTGRGPGEYDYPLFLQANAGRVYLYDITGMRIHAYETDDYLVTKTSLVERWDILKSKELEGYRFGGMKVLEDGNMLAEFYKANAKEASSRGLSVYMLMDIDGNSLDFKPYMIFGNLRIIKEEGQVFPNIFPLGRTLTAVTDNGEILAAQTQDFLIKKYDSTGTYESAIYYPIQGAKLDLEEFLKSGRKFGPGIPDIDEVKKAIYEVGEQIPETNPVIDQLMLDDKNRIWVAVPAGVRSDMYVWWILNESGGLLSKIVLPMEQAIHEIQDEHLYTTTMDEETGAEYVVKYRMEWTKNQSN